MTWMSLTAAAVLLAQANEPPAAPRFDGWPEATPKPTIDCTCRPPGGGKLPLGAEICVRRNGEEVTLRCEMSLNMTIWRTVREGCGYTS